ncbi:MAG: hypothetical protein ACYS8W_19590 [Planctomycetota bacterium]|jgi:hypothetical protein
MRKSIILLLLLVVAGCKTFEPPIPVKEGGSKMVIIPFRETDNRHHFESSIGRDVAERMEGLISQYAEGNTYKIVSFMDIGREMIEELRNTSADEIDWEKIGLAAKADIVLSGNIKMFEVKKPHDVNLFAGTCKVKVFAIGTEDRARLWNKAYTVKHPSGDFALPYDLDADSAQKMRAQLILKTAKKCAEPFYPPLKEDEE